MDSGVDEPLIGATHSTEEPSTRLSDLNHDQHDDQAPDHIEPLLEAAHTAERPVTQPSGLHHDESDLEDLEDERLIGATNSNDGSSTPSGDSNHRQHYRQAPEGMPALLSSPHTTLHNTIPRVPVGSSPRPAIHTPAQSRSRSKTNLFKSWWLEMIASLFFLIVVGAVVATLYPHQGKPLPQWRYHISVNALISIYAVVLKTAIMFVVAEGLGQLKWSWYYSDHPLHDLLRYDEASRGALGSVKLLWRLGFGHPLASWGALITIALLAVDPFTQQALTYYDCSTSLDGQQATLPRTNFFMPPGEHTGALEESIMPPIQNAINAGLFSPGVGVGFDCSSGNCTFPDSYNSLGYCSHCDDISDTLSFVQVCYNISGDPSKAIDCQANLSMNVTSTLPSGLSVTVSAASGGSPDISTMGCTPYGGVEFIMGKLGTLADANLAGSVYGCNSTQKNSTWSCRGYGAASCTLTPCIRSYAATQVTAGRLSETQTDSSGLAQWSIGMGNNQVPLYGLVDRECLSAHEWDSLASVGYDLRGPGRWLAYNVTFDATLGTTPDAPFPQSLLAHQCLYLVDLIFHGSLWEDYLDEYFHGTIQGELDEDSQFEIYSGPQNLQAIYNFGDVGFRRIDDIFHNISDSLTTYIRQNGQANHSEPVRGQVNHYATCLRVRWAWLAFPAALIAMTFIFFVLIVISTRTTKAGIWKSSPLALIFHGLFAPNAGEVEQEHIDRLNDLHGMDQVAKGVIVRLDWKDDILSFVELKKGQTK